MKFNEITVCLDMYGCPNRCKHCWLGTTPNGNMSVEQILQTINQKVYWQPYRYGIPLISQVWYTYNKSNILSAKDSLNNGRNTGIF